MRLGILTSHPIQYQAPLFRALAERLELEVFFAHRQTPEQQAAAGFGTAFEWDVDLLSGYRHHFLANRAQSPGVDRFSNCDTPEIGERIRAGDFDAFLVTGWHLRAYWQAVHACRRLGVPVLVRGDSQLRTPRSWPKRLAKEVVYRGLMRCFDAFLYVGERNREYLLHYGADPGRLFFAPHFVDNAWFHTQAERAAAERDGLRRRLQLGDHEHVVLFVGKLIEKKRPLDLVHAFAMLPRSGPPVRLVLVGSGPLEQQVSRTASALGVRIDLVGFQNQSELPQWYALADLLVLPSGGETWGLVVNEAMACGSPAVTSDAVGCAPDLIEPGTTGMVFPVADVAALAEVIRAMVGRKGEATVRLALEAKMRVYSLETAVAGLVSAIEQVGRF